jgi:hypothetical protein
MGEWGAEGESGGRDRRGAGCGRLLGGLLLTAGGLLLLLGAGALFLALVEGRRVVDAVKGPLSGAQPTAVVAVPTVIVERLRGASDLTTAIMTVETVVDASQDRTLGPFTVGRTRLLYIAHGAVRAGVDLSQLTEGDVDVAANAVTVRLPAPRILDQKVDVERSRVYDVGQSLLAPAAPELQTRAEQAALAQIVRAACAEDILGAANRQAATAVRTLLSATSAVQVHVVTRPPAPDACPTAEPTVAATPAVPLPAATVSIVTP